MQEGGGRVQNEEIEEIINRTVNRTVLKLKMSGLMKDDRKTAYQKTEELLRNYKYFKESQDQPYARKVTSKIEAALQEIRDDIYYDIIPMTYFNDDTRETIALHYGATGTTISRNKKRLMDKLAAMIMTDEFIYEVFL